VIWILSPGVVSGVLASALLDTINQSPFLPEDVSTSFGLKAYIDRYEAEPTCLGHRRQVRQDQIA
jgi:hypothetical protein